MDDTGSPGTAYADQDVSPDTRYVYRIKAINAAGLSPRSDYFNADTPPPPNNPATGVPTITGTAQVGEILTADTSGITDVDGLANATFSYQWVANDGTSDTDIPGKTSPTYTLVSSDEGKTVRLRVSFTDDGGHEETLSSAATGEVAGEAESPARPVGLTGTVTHDQVSLTWDDPGDESITGYQILRLDRDVHGLGNF